MGEARRFYEPILGELGLILEAAELATLEWASWFNNYQLDGAAGLRAACRVRGQLLSLSQSGAAGRAGLTQANQPPRNPGRFSP